MEQIETEFLRINPEHYADLRTASLELKYMILNCIRQSQGEDVKESLLNALDLANINLMSFIDESLSAHPSEFAKQLPKLATHKKPGLARELRHLDEQAIFEELNNQMHKLIKGCALAIVSPVPNGKYKRGDINSAEYAEKYNNLENAMTALRTRFPDLLPDVEPPSTLSCEEDFTM